MKIVVVLIINILFITLLINKITINKLVRRTELKIKNKINDYHWKIINYLTDNYNHILIGNFSTKKFVESKTSPILKRISSRMKFYIFKQRLQYKCFIKKIKYTEIDEYCTSKCCSSCGNFKKDLGTNRIYNCNICGIILGRDINSSKCLYLKAIV